MLNSKLDLTLGLQHPMRDLEALLQPSARAEVFLRAYGDNIVVRNAADSRSAQEGALNVPRFVVTLENRVRM